MKNSVELIGHYGSDEVICCSAWTSTSRKLTPEKRERIPKLIKDLWSAEPVPHKTPFEKGVVHFLINCDIASHIHLIKHRLASVNAESARYKEFKEDKFYLPEDWSDIALNEDKFQTWISVLESHTKKSNLLYHSCLKDLSPVLGRKRAKESARYFKTYNSQIESDVMMNMSCFHNFLKQRMDDHAQVEIKDIAAKMLDCVKSINGEPFKYTLQAWGY